MSQNVPTATRGEDMFLEIERQRRLRLTRFLAPTFAVLLFFIALGDGFATIINPHRPLLTLLGYLGTGISFVLMVVAAYAAQRERINRAILALVMATTIFIFSPSLGWTFSQGVDPTVMAGMMFYGVIIVLAGLLSGRAWVTVATTLGVNALSIFILWYGPQNPDSSVVNARELGIYGPLVIGAQWGIALILLTTLEVFTPAFRELGEVQIAYQRAQQLDEMKNQFITNVNHELRNPIMALQGSLEMLLLTHDHAAPGRLKRMIEEAARTGDDLQSLVEGILDARRIDLEANHFTHEVVNVHAVLMTSVRLVSPREQHVIERDLRMHVPEDLTIWGNNLLLQEILTNLLSNAVKYSPPGSPVEVTCFAVPTIGEGRAHRQAPSPAFVEIQVRDFGLGIPPEQADLLFNRFARLPRDLASTTIGNGLGLYLCKALTEAMGGTIWFDSTGVAGEGTLFHVRLPAASAASPSPTESA